MILGPDTTWLGLAKGLGVTVAVEAVDGKPQPARTTASPRIAAVLTGQWYCRAPLRPRRGGGTGRRVGLKNRCPQGRSGSTPDLGTTGRFSGFVFGIGLFGSLKRLHFRLLPERHVRLCLPTYCLAVSAGPRICLPGRAWPLRGAAAARGRRCFASSSGSSAPEASRASPWERGRSASATRSRGAGRGSGSAGGPPPGGWRAAAR